MVCSSTGPPAGWRRIRSAGETPPEVACETLGYLLAAVRRRLAVLPDAEMLRTFCTRLYEVTVLAARRVGGSKALGVLAHLLDAYLDDGGNRWPRVPGLLAQARFGKRIRRWLATEVASRSDTADPSRAERLKTLAAAVSR